MLVSNLEPPFEPILAVIQAKNILKQWGRISTILRKYYV